MSRPHRHSIAVLLCFAVAATAGSAQPPQPPPTAFGADYLMELARLEDRLLVLAEQIPAERYATPPAEGVHSIAECLSGVAAASRRILVGMEREVTSAAAGEAKAGTPAAGTPAAGDPAAGTPAAGDKERIIADLTAVLAAMRRTVEETTDEGLAAPWDVLGRRWTTRALFLLLLAQTHEGLGHAAAHAESLGIVPPWVQQKRVSDASDD